MADRIVDECGPHNRKDQVHFEANAFHECPGNQRWRDYCESHLEGDKEQVRNGHSFQRLHTDIGQSNVVEATYQAGDAIAKSQAVTNDDPLNADEANRNETEVEGGEDVLTAHHPAVEESQRRRHHQH